MQPALVIPPEARKQSSTEAYALSHGANATT